MTIHDLALAQATHWGRLMCSLPALRVAIGWSQYELARRLGVNDRTVRRWMAGEGEPPPHLLAWLAEVAAWIEAHPAPEKEG